MSENPDSFPIYNLTKTEFELEYLFEQAETISQIKRTIGFYPEIKPSSIDHQYAGEGVFLGARQAALPGTLVGFYPGVVINKLANEFRTVNKMEEKPYLNRHSGVVLDPSIEVPYPLTPFLSLTELEFELSEEMERRGITEIKHILSRIDRFNPYAVGHKINHPFPGKEANVKFVDFKVNFNFFPEEFVKFIPTVKMLKDESNQFYCVGVVSLDFIEPGEELFVDYLEEDIFSDSASPDWLIDPPVKNKLFIKQEYMSLPTKRDESIYKHIHKKMGIEEANYENLIEKRKVLSSISLEKVGEDNILLEKAKKHVKLIESKV